MEHNHTVENNSNTTVSGTSITEEAVTPPDYIWENISRELDLHDIRKSKPAKKNNAFKLMLVALVVLITATILVTTTNVLNWITG